MDNMRLDLEDEANSRSTLDQRLAELRSEVNWNKFWHVAAGTCYVCMKIQLALDTLT